MPTRVRSIGPALVLVEVSVAADGRCGRVVGVRQRASWSVESVVVSVVPLREQNFNVRDTVSLRERQG